MTLTLAQMTASTPILKGELPALEHLLCGYYHQDARADAATDEEIWTLFTSKESYALPELTYQVEVLLAHDSQAIRAFIHAHADALMFPQVEESRAWVESLRSWLTARSSNKTMEPTR
jgi:hypothetical protein